MWSSQLLSVACLSLAAKMEETRVPLLLDLQVLEPKFMFKPKTVQRMELLVMAALKWRLCVITPFDFLDYFFEKLPCLDTNVNRFNCFLSRISDLILASCRVTDYMDYTPSTIAAAAVLLATDHKTISFHERVSNERVKRCQQLLKVHLIQMCQQAAGTEQQLLKPAPPSPVGVLDAASSGRSNTQKFLSMTPSQEETKDLRERRNGETVATL
ncbi:cyclin-D2-1-like [Cornus florida]|uniref:cyclin-D2-1-like n=1 Tax=Cornus florida TaxID=4283 RepID=UPI0028990062|nr:cyclin-D2-1-like [Cornus florida]